MRLELEKAFCKRAKKLLKKNPFLQKAYEDVLLKLSVDPFVFELTAETIHLLDIGTHDEVY